MCSPSMYDIREFYKITNMQTGKHNQSAILKNRKRNQRNKAQKRRGK